MEEQIFINVLCKQEERRRLACKKIMEQQNYALLDGGPYIIRQLQYEAASKYELNFFSILLLASNILSLSFSDKI
jgi:hypothetical protein